MAKPDNDNDDGPVGSFSMRSFLAVAGSVVVCLLIVVVGIYAIVNKASGGSGDDSKAGGGTGHSGSSSHSGREAPKGGNPDCKIKGGSTDIPRSKPDMKWVTSDGAKLAVSSRFGPGKRDSDGAWSCYGHSPTGALLAMIDVEGRRASADNWKQVVHHQIYPAGARQELLSEEPDPPPTDFKYVGFQMTGYSPHRAQAELVVRTKGHTMTCQATAAWQHGDWRLKASGDGSTATHCTPDTPSSIVRF